MATANTTPVTEFDRVINAYYKDLSLNFTPNPNTGSTTTLIDEAAVKGALLNLLRTPLGTKPFDPTYGTILDTFLFKPHDAETENDINDEINRCIEKFETRIKVVSITTDVGDNSIEITINYFVDIAGGRNEVQTLTTTISAAK